MNPIDLHVHSAYSDGVLSPAALCALALQKQIETLALCDHDTTDGLGPMADAAAKCNRAGHRLTVFPAVELSTGEDGHTHILGYGVAETDVPLQAAIAQLRRKRRERGAQMLEALRKLGIELPPDVLPGADAPGTPVGRPHIARALIRAGVVNTMEQAFHQYLLEGKPAYVPLKHITTTQAIMLLNDAGAIPVLAHPVRMCLASQALEALIVSLQTIGLQGLEIYHPSASRRDIRQLEGIAHRCGLLVTGGSDFHGDSDAHTRLGDLPGGWRTWKADVEALTAAMALRHVELGATPATVVNNP
ncbi:MAG: PHP domain-containing protein [Eubacteriales bacterium]|nr:PHP domain-containing protein [Eubacteriales bacterium]